MTGRRLPFNMPAPVYLEDESEAVEWWFAQFYCTMFVCGIALAVASQVL